MTETELLMRLGVALAIGLLIGLERAWVARKDQDGEQALGLRTLGLSGLLGGVAAAVAAAAPSIGAPFLAVVFLIYGTVAAFVRYREMAHDGTYGATSIVAAHLTFALGAFAVLGDPSIAAAAGVCTACVLALKPIVEPWVEQLTWPELRSALLLLTMTVILLPLLPDRGMGPYQALNPRQLWLMAILIAAVSSAGYVAVRMLGDRAGIIGMGLAGGLVSSTAVTLGLAQASQEQPQRRNLFIAGILAAGAIMTTRVMVLAAAFNADLLRLLAVPLGIATLVQASFAAFMYFRDTQDHSSPPIGLTSPFDLGAVLKLGAMLAAVMLATRVAVELLGEAGALMVAMLSGIADVDAISLSMLRLAGNGLSPVTAAAAILLAVATNTLAKAAYTLPSGGSKLALPLFGIAALALLLGGLGLAAMAGIMGGDIGSGATAGQQPSR